MSRIVSVTPKADYCLEVMLDNGNSVMIDFTSGFTQCGFQYYPIENTLIQ